MLNGTFSSVGQKAREKIQKLLRRSLAIREVDAGSCNGCELEIVAKTTPSTTLNASAFNLSHLRVTPICSWSLGLSPEIWEAALLKTYQAMPEPKVVVAVGACGISGGIFGKNYASLGGVYNVVPVDVYIPGCPPLAASSPPRNPARCRTTRRR